MLWIFLYHAIRYLFCLPVVAASWLLLPPAVFKARVPRWMRCAIADHDDEYGDGGKTCRACGSFRAYEPFPGI
jgi:hypothetical protein